MNEVVFPSFEDMAFMRDQANERQRKDRKMNEVVEFTLDRSQQLIIIKRNNQERVYAYSAQKAAMLLFAGRNKGLFELYADETEGAGWYGRPRFGVWKRAERAKE